MLGLSGHSAALMKPGRSERRSVHDFVLSEKTGWEIEGENSAKSWTWLSTVKLLMEDREERRGRKYSSRAFSMSQLDGEVPGVKSENVRW